ncbi:MAG: hypothetical protein WBD20_15530 [Pirellulaceae bacterium]
MFTLFSDPAPVDAIPTWQSFLSPFNEIVGFSSFGLFFLRNNNTNEYGVLHPFVPSVKSYPAFDSLEDFHDQILTDEYFVQVYLRPKDLETLQKSVGPLGEQDIYIPQPYPHMGGSGDLATYDKGDVLVFADIVAQTHGL